MKFLDHDEQLTMGAQRLLLGRPAAGAGVQGVRHLPRVQAQRLDRSSKPGYLAMVRNNFAGWALAVTGLVQRPLSLSLAQLRAMPARTQITRHDCVEGWSAIGGGPAPGLAMCFTPRD